MLGVKLFVVVVAWLGFYLFDCLVLVFWLGFLSAEINLLLLYEEEMFQGCCVLCFMVHFCLLSQSVSFFFFFFFFFLFFMSAPPQIPQS